MPSADCAASPCGPARWTLPLESSSSILWTSTWAARILSVAMHAIRTAALTCKKKRLFILASRNKHAELREKLMQTAGEMLRALESEAVAAIEEFTGDVGGEKLGLLLSIVAGEV